MTLAIFDCDGTIVDSQSGIVMSMVYAFENLGLEPPSRAKTLSVVGLSLPEAFHVLVPDLELGTRERLAERYRDAFRDLDREFSDYEILFPDARSIIERLRQESGMRLGIATGKSRRGVDRLLKRENWEAVFDTIQTADNHPSKPDPSMIVAAMAETGATADATVMIGDTSYDIEMARAAGVSAIGVTWGYHHRHELLDAGAHAIVDHYSELPETIARLVARREGLA